MRTFLTFQDNRAMIDVVILKGRFILIPESLQRHALEQLHVNHMGIIITKLSVHQSIYWIAMNLNIINHIEIASHVLISGNTAGRKNNSQQNSRQTMGSTWSRHVYPTQ